MVIPARMKDTTSQIIKYVVGNGPGFFDNLRKTTIPMMTTAMVNPMGIRMDSFISCILF